MTDHVSLAARAPLTVSRASTPADLSAVEQLIAATYASRLGLQEGSCGGGRFEAQEYVVLARRGQEPVATLTVQSAAFGPDGAAAVGFEFEASYDFASLQLSRQHVAEVRRVAAPGADPRAFRAMVDHAAKACIVAGVRYWIGLVEAQSGAGSDAALVHASVRAHGIAKMPLPLRPRVPVALFDEDALPLARAYGDDVMRKIPLPATVRKFSRVLGAQAISVPSIHPRYQRLVLPMLADVPAAGRRAS